jgi:secreted trypsin-like serine protease
MILLKNSDGAHSVILKEIEVPLWDDAKCQAALRTQFGPSFVLPPTSICAGAEGRDACDVSSSHKRASWPISHSLVSDW